MAGQQLKARAKARARERAGSGLPQVSWAAVFGALFLVLGVVCGCWALVEGDEVFETFAVLCGVVGVGFVTLAGRVD